LDAAVAATANPGGARPNLFVVRYVCVCVCVLVKTIHLHTTALFFSDVPNADGSGEDAQRGLNDKVLFLIFSQKL
jgi:hypothetical protein